MKTTTKIEWTHHTINFWWGCTKVSPACTHCYAEEMGKRFGPKLFGQPVLWGAGKPRFERLVAARKEAVKLQKDFEKRRLEDSEIPSPRVFVNSMSDWLDEEVPAHWLAWLLQTIRLCPNLDFQMLTKRPENFSDRMLECKIAEPGNKPEGFNLWLNQWMYGGWEGKCPQPPPNVWIGTTVENQRYADERIPALLRIPAKVRFLSMEPLSGAVKIESPLVGIPWLDSLDWIIAGGESGGKAEPAHPDWFRSLRDQCQAACVPFFFKQWGEWIPVSELRYLESNPSLARSYKGQKLEDGTLMLRVGKDLAGHLLDGQEWHEFPKA